MSVRCRALRPRDYPDVLRIIADAFPEQATDNPGALAEYAREPWYDPGHLLVAEEDGRVVSQLGVRVGTLWCAGMALPAGLLGTVCTLSSFRGRGIGAQLVRHAHGVMARRGLALATLHTSPQRHGFYGRLGYRRAIQETSRLTLPASALRIQGACAAPRQAVVADAARLDAIYAACYGTSTGAWSRSLPFWRRRLQQRPKLWSTSPIFLVNGGDPVRAYAAVEEREGTGVIQELASAPGEEQVAVGLLAGVAGAWLERGIRTMEVMLSSTHPLRSLVRAQASAERTSHGTVLLQVIDTEAFVTAALALLDRRARAVGVEISLRLSPDTDYVHLGTGEKLRLALSTQNLAVLLYNGCRLDELRAGEGFTVEPEDSPHLPSIFPDTGAARCPLDAY